MCIVYTVIFYHTIFITLKLLWNFAIPMAQLDISLGTFCSFHSASKKSELPISVTSSI